MSNHLHDHPFKFYRIRGGSTERIYPHAGVRLHFGSREADSLSLPTLPVGTLAAGDMVKVTYTGNQQLETSNPKTVFLGTVEKRVLRKTGGSEQTETVTVLGPWSKMARTVYRQNWAAWVRDDEDSDPYLGTDYSSRLILNETKQGQPQNLDSELDEIATHAAHACGYSVGDIDVSTQVLPSDECRDITVADAIRRELRLFPRAVARFDYSSGTPALVINRGQTAAYDVADKTEREIEYDEHPITGVDLEIETTGEINGASYRTIGHQTAGDTTAGNPDCLYATIQVKGASANAVCQTFTSVTENVPSDLNSVGWWKQKHPRLATVALSAIKSITDGARTPSNYGRISAATAGELEDANLGCEVSKFTCKVTIETEDDTEEDIYLTAHFLTTNAEGTASEPKTYRWIAESSTESGEWVPEGLAEAILAERCGSIRSEKMTIRLGDAFPLIGDTITDEDQTLPLQSVDIDCADLTANLVFGAPEYLSPEDMASLLSNFRNKRTTSSSTVRKTGKKEDGGTAVKMGGIPPLSSTEFQPGTKSHTTIKAASGSGGSIDLDSSELEGGEKVSVHKLTVKASGDEEDKEYKILGTEDVEIEASAGKSGVESLNGLTGQISIIGGDSIKVEKVGENAIKISYVQDKEPDPEPEVPANPCDHPGDPPGGWGGVPADEDEGGVHAGAGGGGGAGGVPADETGSDHFGDACPDCSPRGVPAE